MQRAKYANCNNSNNNYNNNSCGLAMAVDYKPIDVAGQRVRPSVLGSTLLHPCTFLTPPPLPTLSLSVPSLGVALKNKNENIANCNTTQTKWQQKATQRSAGQQAAAAQTVARGNIANRTEQLANALPPPRSQCSEACHPNGLVCRCMACSLLLGGL